MSHFSQIKTEFKNQEALLAALKTFGLNPVVHKEAVELTSYYHTQGQAEKGRMAHIVVPNNQLNHKADIGFFWNGTAYEAIIDRQDANAFLYGRRGDFMPLLKAQYSRYVVLEQAQRSGMQVIEEVEKNGEIRIRLRPQQQAGRTGSAQQIRAGRR